MYLLRAAGLPAAIAVGGICLTGCSTTASDIPPYSLDVVSAGSRLQAEATNVVVPNKCLVSIVSHSGEVVRQREVAADEYSADDSMFHVVLDGIGAGEYAIKSRCDVGGETATHAAVSGQSLSARGQAGTLTAVGGVDSPHENHCLATADDGEGVIRTTALKPEMFSEGGHFEVSWIELPPANYQVSIQCAIGGTLNTYAFLD